MLDLPTFANNAAAIEFQPKAKRHDFDMKVGAARSIGRRCWKSMLRSRWRVLRPAHPVTGIRGPMKPTFVITGEIGACPQK